MPPRRPKTGTTWCLKSKTTKYKASTKHLSSECKPDNLELHRKSFLPYLSFCFTTSAVHDVLEARMHA